MPQAGLGAADPTDQGDSKGNQELQDPEDPQACPERRVLMASLAPPGSQGPMAPQAVRVWQVTPAHLGPEAVRAKTGSLDHLGRKET